MRRVLTWCLLLSSFLPVACSRDSLVACESNWVCPAETTCVVTNAERKEYSCANEPQLRACVDAAEGAACSVPNEPAGKCIGGACLPTICGDGRVVSPEQCEDGNTADGDGCSRDCLSDETCGNGVRDSALGETCDLGTSNSNLPNAKCRVNCREAMCGDGIVDDLVESCDVGDANSNQPNATCRSNCQPQRCGDGIVDSAAGEICDGASSSPTGYCSNDCKSTGVCGNGYLDAQAIVVSGQPGGLEDCDLGAANSNGPNAVCRPNCKVSRCGDGIVDDLVESCDAGDANSNQPNAACRSNCQPQRCGDGIVDSAAGEICDGGASSPTGYCSNDCKSTGVCGNGYIDAAPIVVPGRPDRGSEECDSGLVTLAGDGCTQACTVETTNWQPALTPQVFRARYALAYDSIRERVVMFGGATDTGLLSDTWEWNPADNTWTQMPTTVAPSPRIDAVMVFDEVRGKTVLFGGFNSNLYFNDTWEWDGTEWVEKRANVGSEPLGRHQHAMAFDGDRVILFGGYNGTFLSGTWLWDGTTWTQAGGNQPPLRYAHAMALHARLAKSVMLVGGINPAGELVTDVWRWQNSTWTQIIPATTPPVSLLFRPALAGNGTGITELSNAGQYWRFNGTNWSQRVSSPQSRTFHSMAWNGSDFFSVGGYDPAFNVVNNAELHDDTRNELLGFETAPRNAFHAMAWDVDRGQAIVFGGDRNTGPSRETLLYTAGQWRRLMPAATEPPARHSSALGYDRVSKRMVLFGGFVPGFPGGFGNDTWAMTNDGNAAAWTNLTPAGNNPIAGRVFPTMFFDEVRGKLIMSGGLAPGGVDLTDMYEFTGNGWTNITPTAANNALRSYNDEIAYDSHRRVAVLVSESGTWEWDGSVWRKRAEPAQGPAPRMYHTLVYDPLRRKTVLFGGVVTVARDDAPIGVIGDTWEWDGQVWQRRNYSTNPGARRGAAAVFDSIHGNILLYGGDPSATLYLNDTWTLSATSESAAADDCTSATIDFDGDGALGCADPDCWGRCTPHCPPSPQWPNNCSTTPRCGDGTCSVLESEDLCPVDCAL